MNSSFAFSDPESAIEALAERLQRITETEHVSNLLGRVLANPLIADRDSPAADVSAMDGYGISLADLQSDHEIPISGESKAGSPPPSMNPGCAIRIFTGAIVPVGCDAVIKREETEEQPNTVRLLPSAVESTVMGSNIRRRGENSTASSMVLDPGTLVTSAVMATLANFGCVQSDVVRKVRVAVLTTGNEVMDPETELLEPWQLRNSNRVAVKAAIDSLPCATAWHVRHIDDDPATIETMLIQAIESCDAVVLTGGVSKGDHDYVPETIQRIGGDILFHGLPIRPGKPILGAATDQGKLILGLPGNPVSTTVNAIRFLKPLLRFMAGASTWKNKISKVEFSEPLSRSIPLHTMPLVQLDETGKARLIASKGSGDLVALGLSDGFVCVPPNETSVGPWPVISF